MTGAIEILIRIDLLRLDEATNWLVQELVLLSERIKRRLLLAPAK